MKISLYVLIPFFTLVSTLVQGHCLSASALQDNMDVTLAAQISYVNKEPSIWKLMVAIHTWPTMFIMILR